MKARKKNSKSRIGCSNSKLRYYSIPKEIITIASILRWFRLSSMLSDAGLHKIRWKHISNQVHQRVDGGNILRRFLAFRGGAANSRLDRNNENYT